MIVGALCVGYGGLELALDCAGIPHTVGWHAETDPHAAVVFAAHWPTPNLGDITQLEEPPHADIITAGFPCQPVSTAGRRNGTADERWLIDDVARVAADSGAHTVVLENVPGLLSAGDGDAMGRVVAALAEGGFVEGRWDHLAASDIGAPHRRERWFCVARTADVGRERPRKTWDGRPGPADDDRHAAADADGERSQERRIPAEGRSVVADSAGGGALGPYTEAADRWAAIIGRPWPAPLTDQRLNPRFVEWMMGLPDGWVTDHVASRTAALRVLGNGVVPLQAAAAIGRLLEVP